MIKQNLLFLLLFFQVISYAQQIDSLVGNPIETELLEGEFWWTGVSSLGHEGPYDKNSIVSFDFWADNAGNQAQPILLSSKGRYIWCESPIKYSFDKGLLKVTTTKDKIIFGKCGNNLKTAFEFAVKNFFPPNGKIPHEIMFSHPQYNTWIELVYNQNEEDILKYAKSIIDHGYPPGVIMIDDNWQENYGVWDFSPRRFKNPKKMIKQLHEMGFKVMLWVCPFISPDSQTFRHLAKEGMLILDHQKEQDVLWSDTKNKSAVIRWWNGASACLDLSNPKTVDWFKGQLNYLIDEYSVDGFKFDAGDANFYANNIHSFKPSTPNDHTTYFAEIGLDYPLNEYRASWKMAGYPLVQRLRDKEHKWEDLKKLIPDQMSQSLMGYAYTCPDMIGGGEYQSFQNISTIDEELIVRSAQVHALMPMMQFSVAPWRVLSKENNKICLEAALLHTKMADYILELTKKASITGKPIVQPMALAYPKSNFENVKDQFLLGDDIIIAPVVEQGMRKRDVILPKGKWKADDGKVYKGNKTITISVPLNRLPYFRKIK